MDKKSNYFNLIILLILVAAIFLRFWKFWEIPFTFDELSALYRLQFDSLGDVIRFGVIPDGHPAGVQVFLYYWIKLFGDREIVVKLPFLLAGLASVYLAYRLGSMWFNPTTGILTAAYMASLQLWVMYSQIARPYASGLFLTLMMVFYWSKYFFEGNKLKHLLLFVIFASLSTYNHHFSLLFVAVVGLSGLWYVNTKTRLPYIFAGVAIFALYTPHLSIFFSQLAQGGLGGWLNKPGPWFLFEFLNWLFHFSIATWLVLLGVWLFAIYTPGDMSQPEDAVKKRKLLLLWFFVPLVVGYTYSVLYEPVLQYSLLIFSTPYLFILFFSVVKNIAPRRAALLVIIILMVNTASLVWEREYYRVFYTQAYEEAVKHAIELESTQFKDQVFLLDNYLPFFNEYYFRKYGKHVPYYTIRNKDLNINGFREVLAGIEKMVVVTSGLKPDYFQFVGEKFPFLVDYDYGFTFEQYTFSKYLFDEETQLPSKVVAGTDFKNQLGNWRLKEKNIEIDTVDGSRVFHLKPEIKYGPYINLPLRHITESRHLFIDIEVQVQPLSDQKKSAVVVTVKKGNETLWWKSVNFADLQPEQGQWTRVFLTIDLMTAIGQKEDPALCRFETFLWNPDDGNYLIRLYKITSRPGNPYRYALFYDIEDQGFWFFDETRGMGLTPN